ncbi:MAG: hypothetical protein IPM08_12490 [Actinomycetales bacterium]|nr:hypothetical protein [Actinomycetales bacterium]
MIAFEAMAVSTAMPRAAEELGAIGGYGLAFSSMMTAMLGIVAAGSGPIGWPAASPVCRSGALRARHHRLPAGALPGACSSAAGW